MCTHNRIRAFRKLTAPSGHWGGGEERRGEAGLRERVWGQGGRGWGVVALPNEEKRMGVVELFPLLIKSRRQIVLEHDIINPTHVGSKACIDFIYTSQYVVWAFNKQAIPYYWRKGLSKMCDFAWGIAHSLRTLQRAYFKLSCNAVPDLGTAQQGLERELNKCPVHPQPHSSSSWLRGPCHQIKRTQSLSANYKTCMH